MKDKMKVEIWSDVVCPFCYIGKRKFESALNSFPQKDSIQVVWRSFELNPSLQYQPERDPYEYIAQAKGQTREWSVKVHQSLTETARKVGLNYHFDLVKITNSFDAHRLIQLAAKYNLADELEERFFKAYFTDGELMSDHETLIRLSTEVGLPKEQVAEVLKTNQYSEDVKRDVSEAKQIGVNGVPFFLMNRKYAVSGAQETSVFTVTLQKALDEWKKDRADLAP
jgi:protein disulfide-isomerase